MKKKLYKYFLLFKTIIFFSITINAQKPGVNQRGYANAGGGETGSVKGIVVNSVSMMPLEYAYIVIHKESDSSLVNGGISDSTGKFKIEKIPFGKYYLAANLIGHKPQKISGIVIGPKNPVKVIDTVKLAANSTTLGAFEIKDKKSDVEFSLDKKVINVEKNLVSVGGSAVDVMQNIPSVTVDIDGNLSMKGSSNITVLIDGKPSGLTGASRSAVLEQIPASSVESIEIISNPSAKYDPDGMTGIINILLKKKKERGYHGIFTVNAGTGDKYNGSVSFNYSKNKVNLFAGYDVRSRINKGTGYMKRKTYFDTVKTDSVILADVDTTLINNSTSVMKGISHNIKAGMDYYMNAKNSFTLSAVCGISDDDHSDFTKSSKYVSENIITDYYENSSSEPGNDVSLDLALYYKRTFKKKDESLTADAAFTNSSGSESEDQSIQYYLPDMSAPLNSPVKQRTESVDKNKLGSFQVDYSYPFSKKSRLEAGLKSIIRSVDNDYVFQNFISDVFVDDTVFSNRFIYDEQIHSLYSTYSNTIGKFGFQVGLRAEQALTKSTQKTTTQEFNKDYFSIFPAIHLNLNMKNDNSFQLSYSRRVNRPNFRMLNPFVEMASPGIYRHGNPYLMPEYIDSYELGHLKYWKSSSLNSSVFYKQINDAVQRFISIDSNGIQYVTQKNISSGTSYGLEFVVSQDFYKWWKVNWTFSYFKTVMKGTVDESNLTTSNYSWTAKFNTTMTVLKNLDLQLTGNYRAPMTGLQVNMKAMYSADFALKKDVFKNASVSVRLSDIFNTRKMIMEGSGTNFEIYHTRKRDSRVLLAGFTYKINGGTKSKEKKKSFDNDNENQDIEF